MSPPPLPKHLIEERLAVLARCDGNVNRAGRELGLSNRAMQNTVTRARQRGISVRTWTHGDNGIVRAPGRLDLNVVDGTVLIGSDAHYWPGVVSAAHRALVRFAREMRPRVLIMNGDMLDGATISRHPPIGWESRPSLVEEIEAVKDRLGELVVAAEGARRYWPLGNHDARLETRIATVAPEFARVHGVHLSDHFPDWEKCWSIWINDDVAIKHRNRGGIHATRNNTLNAGVSMVTGHLHSLKVTPLSDYRGTRWGVDTGTLAHPYGDQFQYMEDNPRDHRSGFIVLTFRDGRLMWPEIVHVLDEARGLVEFRGEILEV